jgi:hypothetical protein
MDEQQQLIQAIFKRGNSSELGSELESDSGRNKECKITEAFGFDRRGLAIYQRNLQANAVNALSITFPTVMKLIGDDLFAYAADLLVKQSPPDAGDWGLWGCDFADVLSRLATLQDFPYVADLAQLDFLLHRSSREKDVEVDMDSMSLLATCELDQLRVVLNPAIKDLSSKFPIVDIYRTNHGEQDQVERDAKYLKQAKRKLLEGEGQTALIYRPQFKPLVRAIDSAEQQWLRLIKRGLSIGKTLDALVDCDQEFSLEQWLPLALNQNLISHLEKI